MSHSNEVSLGQMSFQRLRNPVGCGHSQTAPQGVAKDLPLIVDGFPLLIALSGISYCLVSLDVDIGRIMLDRTPSLGLPHYLLGLVAVSFGDLQMLGMDFFAAELSLVLAGAMGRNLSFPRCVVKLMPAAELFKRLKRKLLQELLANLANGQFRKFRFF